MFSKLCEPAGRLIAKSLVNLDESEWSGLLYHSTPESFNPKKVEIGSHFGSVKASKDRAADIVNTRDDDTPIKFKVHAYQYKPSGKSVGVEDDWTGYSAHTSIASQLHDRGIINDKEHEELGTDKKYDVDVKQLSRILKSKGISSVNYKNAGEDVGKDSHVIYDPENLRHVRTFDNPRSLRNMF